VTNVRGKKMIKENISQLLDNIEDDYKKTKEIKNLDLQYNLTRFVLGNSVAVFKILRNAEPEYKELEIRSRELNNKLSTLLNHINTKHFEEKYEKVK
jgi:hypothetical protein